MTTHTALSDPHPLVLEAQSRIATGPHLTRPLTNSVGPDPLEVLRLVIASVNAPGDAPMASPAQVGSFLAAMSIRRSFPDATGWSEDERHAVSRCETDLSALPPPYDFLFDPGSPPPVRDEVDTPLVRALQEILLGRNLDYDRARAATEAVLSPDAHPALAAAFLIGQRMNLETYEEFCAHLDAVFDRSVVQPVDVDTLTHIGEPYNGSARFFKPTLFVAMVRAAQDHRSLLHGVDRLPPKFGVTEEGILSASGAEVDLSLSQAARLIENPEVGFAYVSQRVFAPRAYAAAELRHHIGKRPPWAATEKAQRLLQARRNIAVIGFYHPGYEHIHLKLMQEERLDAGLLVKGEEGTSQFSLRPRDPRQDGLHRVNHVEGFRGAERIAEALDPTAYGFSYDASPRADRVTAEAFAKEGRNALSGEPGPNLDRIVINAAALNVLLGNDPNPAVAVEHVRETIATGDALRRLDAYIEHTRAF